MALNLSESLSLDLNLKSQFKSQVKWKKPTCFVFETVICFPCPEYCSVQKNDVVSQYVSQVKINVSSNWLWEESRELNHNAPQDFADTEQ